MGYRPEFLDYLKTEMRVLRLKIFAVPEGSVIFPHEPIVVFEGELASVRIAEGIFLKECNFPTLSMTKWHRVVEAASPGKVLEFARRRAQDDARTSLYAHMAGCAFSSNANMRRGFNIPVVGTQGHEGIQSYGDEFTAFDKWLEFNPDRPTLLVDTIDTLKSGLPNAIKAFKKHWNSIKAAGGKPAIRNDSGDLAYITIEERIALDKAGLTEVVIVETNDLDEYNIQSIKGQIFTACERIGMDPKSVLEKIIWAAGTMPGTCYDQPSLGGVAKLGSIGESDETRRGVIKLATDNPVKTSIPGANRSVHVWKGDDLLCCLIHDKDEDPSQLHSAKHPDDYQKNISLNKDDHLRFEPRQNLVWDSTSESTEEWFKAPSPTLQDVRDLVKVETDRLHWTMKRFENPHAAKVSLSPNVQGLRHIMIENKQLIQSPLPRVASHGVL